MKLSPTSPETCPENARSRSADFPVCGFAELSSSVFRARAITAPPPADLSETALSFTLSKLRRMSIAGALLCLLMIHLPIDGFAQSDDPTRDPRLDTIRQAVETTQNQAKYVRADARTLGRR